MVSCCFGSSLSTGAKLIGFFSLLGAAVSVLFMWGVSKVLTEIEEHPEIELVFKIDIMTYAYQQHYSLELESTIKHYSVGQMYFQAITLSSLASMALSVMLLIGVYQRKVQYVRMWVILYSLLLLLDFVVKLVVICNSDYDNTILLVFIFTPLYLYYIVVVHGHYKELIQDRYHSLTV